jgi:ribosomal protein S18 acetylase RimI-like enzyme
MPRPSDELLFDPPTPANNAPGVPFTQTIHLNVAGKQVGSCLWHHAGESQLSGVVQIIDLTILDPKHRRQGHGKRLLNSAIDESVRYCRLTPSPLRQLWIAVPHTQAIARAFLTGAGFHHVSSLNYLHPEQELLIYVLSLD